MLLTIMLPYYTVYSSLMTFKIVDIRKKKLILAGSHENLSAWELIKVFLMILPSMLVLMAIIDVIFMGINLIVTVGMLLLFVILRPCKKERAAYERYEYWHNRFFTLLFGMSIMDVRGFKCQRTILQLQLESFPQILFQVYLWRRIKQLQRENFNATISVSPEAIEVSILTAIVHLVFEVLNLRLESKTSKTNFLDYMIACYSARQGWLP